nr:protein PFC0760c [Misgurnus anguillicaudatus]
MADFWKDRFPDFEDLHFSDDDNTTPHGDNITEREPVTEDNNNHREDRVSEPDEDLAESQSCTDTIMEVETKNCSMDGVLEDQSVKTGTMLFGSSSDYDSDERKTQPEDHEQDELEMPAETSDIHQITAHFQMEDVGFLEKVSLEETHIDQGTPKYQIVTEEETSHLLSCQMVDEPEDTSLASEEDGSLMEVQSKDEMKDFTEDDHVEVVEGLADYSSELSESENESSSEGHESDAPTNMNNKMDADNLEADCLAITSMDNDDNERNHREDSEPDEDLAETQSCTDTDLEVETENCFRNSMDGLLDDQSGKSDERKTRAEDHEEERKDNELEILAETSDIHQMTAHFQVEDVGLLEKVPTEETKEETSHLLSCQMADEPEDTSSASDEDETSETFEEHVFQHAPDNKEANDFKQLNLEDSSTQLMKVKSRDEMKEFTEDDHVGAEEGLADYPSDRSESENESSGEGHEGDPNIKVDAENLEADFLVIASMDDENERNRGINPAEMVTDSGNAKKSYMNEQHDYDSDISSDDDDDNGPTVYMHETIASQEPENPYTNDFVRDWKSIECEEAYIHPDSQNPERHDAGGLSDTPALPETVDSRMESPSAYETHTSENPNNSVRQLDPSRSYSNVSNVGENLNTLLPETFWNLIEQDNLKFDDWDVNEEEAICNEEEVENEEEEMERDWEKERARIEAFNTYYTSFEGEDNVGRSPKVTFCLETESIQYEDEYSSSEEEPSTDISELYPAEPNVVDIHQSNKEHNSKPLEVSDAAENIQTVTPETLWSSKLLIDEENLKFNDSDHDIDGDDVHKPDTSEVICDEKEPFFKKLKYEDQEIKGDREQEQSGAEYMYHIEFTEWENEVTERSHKYTLSLDQESSQNEDNESSEQESNTEDDNSNIKTKDLSESDEPKERRLYTGKQKVLPKGLQKPDKKLKEPKSKCLVLLRSVLALSLATAVGVLSYWWVTDSLDWIY